jgi:pyrimidine operon attenuation protein / uracil phosphoribosyltransferase
MGKTLMLNKKQIDQKINRIAYQIYEDSYEENEVIIAGIAPNGFKLAKKIADVVEKISPLKTKLITIDFDKENPLSKSIEVSISSVEMKDKVVILVDDVLNSGKTLIFGLKPFLNASVRKIRTVVLVDRNHKRFPVSADFVGVSMATTLQEHISVELNGNEAVYLS